MIDEGRRDSLAARDEFERAGERYIYVYGLINLGRIEDLTRIRKPPSLCSRTPSGWHRRPAKRA